MLKIWKSSLDQNKHIITTRGPVSSNNQLFSNPGIDNENMWMLEVILNVNSILLGLGWVGWDFGSMMHNTMFWGLLLGPHFRAQQQGVAIQQSNSSE